MSKRIKADPGANVGASLVNPEYYVGGEYGFPCNLDNSGYYLLKMIISFTHVHTLYCFAFLCLWEECFFVSYITISSQFFFQLTKTMIYIVIVCTIHLFLKHFSAFSLHITFIYVFCNASIMNMGNEELKWCLFISIYYSFKFKCHPYKKGALC